MISNVFKFQWMPSVLRRTLCISFVMLMLFATSCDDDDRGPSGQFSDGVFVVNEGNFGRGNGSITHLSDGQLTTQDVFGLVNNGRALGDVVQSMTIHDNVAFIVVNNSKRVEVVTASTFETLYSIDGLALPRYLTVEGDFAYVTEWVSFTEPGRVSVIDLDTRAVVDQITVGSGAENIRMKNDLLYVSNSFTNTVSVIDPERREVIKTIEVASSPGELLEDADGKIWVVCGGSYQGNDGALVQIDPSKSRSLSEQSVVKTVELDKNISMKGAISGDLRDIFYFSDRTIYRVNIASASPEQFLEETASNGFYSIGIDPETNILYAGDAKGFTSSGTVFRYQLSGDAIDSFTSGIGPCGFAFHH